MYNFCIKLAKCQPLYPNKTLVNPLIAYTKLEVEPQIDIYAKVCFLRRNDSQ